MPTLAIRPKNGKPSWIRLAGQLLRIGRSPQNDLVLPDHFSSTCHAIMYPTADGYAIEDQGSKNGTFVNSVRISGKAPLADGDEVVMGSTRCSFSQRDETEVAVIGDTTLSHSSSKIYEVRDILQNQYPPPSPAAAGSRAAAVQSPQGHKLIAALSEASQALIFPMTLEDILPRIMDLIVQNVAADRCILMLKEKGVEDLITRCVRIQNGSFESRNITISRSILKTAIEKNCAILISDIQSDRKLKEQQSIFASQIHSALCVPMYNDKEIVGLIYADRIALLGQFSEDDLKLLTVLANLAALKIENARLFGASREMAEMEQELIMAQKIQMHFLPRGAPAFEPYDISGRTLACRHVGGDYYDFIPKGDSGLCLVVADVSGHGVSAGLLMTSLRSSLHAMLPAIEDFAQLAAKLNNTVHAHSDSHSFISLFIGLLRSDRDEMTYVNAGHTPPFLLDPRGQVQSLDSTGFCLGMFPDVRYQSQTVEIAPGAILCLLTDGILEQRNRYQEEFGQDRLISRLRDLSGLPSCEILEKTFDDFFCFAGSTELSDDLTLVVVKKAVP